MTEVNVRANLMSIIYHQLPETLRDVFRIRVTTDAYLLRPTVVFTGPDGREWPADLEPVLTEGLLIRTKVPDATLALLCTVV